MCHSIFLKLLYFQKKIEKICKKENLSWSEYRTCVYLIRADSPYLLPWFNGTLVYRCSIWDSPWILCTISAAKDLLVGCWGEYITSLARSRQTDSSYSFDSPELGSQQNDCVKRGLLRVTLAPFRPGRSHPNGWLWSDWMARGGRGVLFCLLYLSSFFSFGDNNVERFQ